MAGDDETQATDPPADDASRPDGFDVDGAEARLKEVEKKIEEGRHALDDVEDDVEPTPDGPPIADGEGAANAPPG